MRLPCQGRSAHKPSGQALGVLAGLLLSWGLGGCVHAVGASPPDPACRRVGGGGPVSVAAIMPGEYQLLMWRGRYRAAQAVSGVLSLVELEGSEVTPLYGRARLDVSRLQVTLELEHDPAAPEFLTVLAWSYGSLNIGGGMWTDGGIELKVRAVSPAGWAGTWRVWAQPELSGSFCAVRQPGQAPGGQGPS